MVGGLVLLLYDGKLCNVSRGLFCMRHIIYSVSGFITGSLNTSLCKMTSAPQLDEVSS